MIRVSYVFLGLILLAIATAGSNPHTHQKIRENHANKLQKLKSTKTSSDTTEPKENSLESVVLAIDTGVKNYMAKKSKPDIVDDIAKLLMKFAKNSAKPIYRSKGQEYNIKPEIIHFRSDKPSVMFEIDSKSIINVLKDLLESKSVHRYMDKFSKEAAVIYRSVKQELDKPQTKKMRNKY